MKRQFKPEMKFGADRKKVAILGGLLLVLVVVWFINRTDSPGAPAQSTAPRTTPAAGAKPATRPVTRTVTRGSGLNGRAAPVQEFHPVLKSKDPVDTSRDPTLSLDILAKVRGVKLEGGSRSLFDFGAAPAPAKPVEVAKLTIIPKGLEQGLTTGPVKPKAPAPPPPPPPPPPIPLKFYGYTGAQRPGPRRALFLEGEEIFVAAEGDLIKNRYKVIRIGVNSVVVEDTTNKNQQTLPLVEEAVNS